LDKDDRLKQIGPDSVVGLLDREFAATIESLFKLTRSVPAELIYQRPPVVTIGENILRSAGVVEQMSGGLIANLWDDPFEWTLPEELSTTDRILEYLLEVEASRFAAFKSIKSDEVLLKLIALPSGESCKLFELLLRTLARACDYRGRAMATLKMLSDVSAPGFII